VQTNASEKPSREEQRTMTTEYQSTPEEEAYGRLLDEKWQMLSGAARTVLSEAQSAAYADNLVRSYCFGPEDYGEAMEKMRLATAELAGQDREILVEIVGATRAAAASIDQEDRTPAGHKVDRGDVRWYYTMVSGMVEESIKDETFFVRTPQSGS
jgi:hypothetical protein